MRDDVERPRPGDGLLHPAVLGAVLLLVVNDHWAKARFPGFATGKLSDLAGMVFFPLLLVALAEVVQGLRGRFLRPSLRALVIAVGATGLVFALVKTTSCAADAYRLAWAALQWPAHALLAVANGAAVPGLRPVRVAEDATDLVALPALVVAWLIGARRALRARDY
jgi:hypothetical protein